jgi:hypothetical protein
MKICEECGMKFDARRSDQRFCNESCRSIYKNNKRNYPGNTRVNENYPGNEKDKEIDELKRKVDEQGDKLHELEEKYNKLYDLFLKNVKIVEANFNFITGKYVELQNRIV